MSGMHLLARAGVIQTGDFPKIPNSGSRSRKLSWTCWQLVALYLFVAIQGPPGTVHEKRPKTVNTRLVKRALRRYRLAEGEGGEEEAYW